MKRSFNFESFVITIVMLLMLGLTFIGVISRYILHFSFSFTEELVCAMFVLLSTMGGALASKEKTHYTLDLVTGLMRPKTRKFFLIFDTGLTCLAATILGVTAIQMVISQYKIGSLSIALKIPSWIYGTFVPFGLAFFLFRSIQIIIRAIKAKAGEEGNEE